MTVVRTCTHCRSQAGPFGKDSWLCNTCLAAYKRTWRPSRIARGATFRSFVGERISNWRIRARKLGVPFDLDCDYLAALYEKQEARCIYTGELLSYFKSTEAGHALPCSASLDRLYPELGYVRVNVAWASYFANTAKGVLSYPEFVAFCERVVERAKLHNWATFRPEGA